MEIVYVLKVSDTNVFIPSVKILRGYFNLINFYVSSFNYLSVCHP